ncbi:MAG: cysteine-rich CWC family protein [Pyrinomonadaceae bacterium]
MSAPIKESASSSVSPSSICAACGEEFSCGANSGCEAKVSDCWCFDVKLSETVRTQLQTRYQGCLCNNCLLAFASDQPTP